MKKYLINGVLALSVGAFLFSCSEKESEYVPLAQQKVQAFEEVFKEVYGDNIDPYQRWGFSDKSEIANGDSVEPTIIDEEPALIRTLRAGTRGATTRAANPNGNEWCKTYDNVPYALTEHQKDIVRQYFQQVKDPVDIQLNFTDFFVQDVYKGGTNTTDALTTETYTTAYGTTFTGSNQMDRLTCAGRNGVGDEHISNYNNAQCSWRSDIKHLGDYVDGYTPYTRDNYDTNKGWENCETENFNHLKQYTDKIMLMEDCSTKYFGYQNSLQSSNRYNDMFTRVSGNEIMRWARINHKTIYGDGDVSGMYFVGFDYEADLSHGLTDTYQGNSYLITEVDENTPGAFQVPNKNDGKWYIAGARDHYYSDWIIRIVPGNKKPEHEYGEGSREYTWNRIEDEWAQDLSQSGRVFCEDLGKATRYDIDYNDVVFDVIIWQHTHTVQPMKKVVTWTTTDGVKDANSEETTGAYADGSPSEHTVKKYAQVRLMAAGGTIYLTVLNQEVHDAFGVGVTTMVNTRDDKSTAFGSYQDLNPVDIGTYETSVPFNGTTYNLKLFENISTADQVTIISNFNGNTIAELTAKTGEAPHKLFVPNFTTQWTSERMQLKDAYPAFAGYVYNSTNTDWYKNYDPNYLYSKRYVGLETMPRIMKTVRISDTENMDNLTSTTYPFGSNWNLYEIYLQNVSSFTPGDRIRFYASGVSEGSRIRVLFANSSSNYFVDADYVVNDKDNGANTSNACIEVILDDASCQELNNSKKEGKLMIQVQGKDFVLDRITRLAAAQ